MTDDEFQAAIAAGGLTALQALSARCAADVTATKSVRELGTLYRRLQSLVGEIDKLRDIEKAEGDAVDQLQKRRERRRRQA